MPITEETRGFADVAPWPDRPAAADAAIGHNKPPLSELIPLEFRETLLAERPDFLTRMRDLVDAANRARADDDETLGRCGNLVKAYRECIKHIDATHTAVKQPYLEGSRLVDAEKNALIFDINEAKAKVEGVGNAFVAKRQAAEDAERARIAAEQRAAAEASAAAERERERVEQEAIVAAAAAEAAARKAAQDGDVEAAVDAEIARQVALDIATAANDAAEQAMAAAALAPAMPAKAEPVRSDEGATISGKQDWKSEVTDYTVAFIHVEDHPKVREAIDKAIAQQVKAGKRTLPGVRIWPVAKANFR